MQGCITGSVISNFYHSIFTNLYYNYTIFKRKALNCVSGFVSDVNNVKRLLFLTHLACEEVVSVLDVKPTIRLLY